MIESGDGPGPGDAGLEPGTIVVAGLFPTPLISARLGPSAACNAELVATILAREQVERGVTVSNQGGWHSNEFLSWCGPAGHMVLDAARELVDQMTVMQTGQGFGPARVGWHVTAWANIHRAGDGNRPHAHPGAFWSGVYWVDDGGGADAPEVGGLLEMADPRGVMPSMYAPHLRCAVAACHGDGQGQAVTPEAGTMVLFPSWLVHSVSRYAGARPRVSIAFNFSLGGTTTLATGRDRRRG